MSQYLFIGGRSRRRRQHDIKRRLQPVVRVGTIGIVALLKQIESSLPDRFRDRLQTPPEAMSNCSGASMSHSPSLILRTPATAPARPERLLSDLNSIEIYA